MAGKFTARRVGFGLASAAALGLVVAVAASHRLRDSFTAAYRGFQDPSRVRPTHVDDEPLQMPAASELEQPEIGMDFEVAADTELGDAGALEQLSQPDLGVPISKRTIQFVHYFVDTPAGRKAFIERLRRSGRYKAIIEQALRDAGVPDDFVWLVAIESAFNPQAVSPKGATGLFQFMPETAEKYGLAMDNWVDERRSIGRASAAGARHLRDLYEHYGRWDLTLAAYNYGKDPIDEAIAKFNARLSSRERGEKKGKPVEFKDLAEARVIPKETANFVPQIQAFAIVAANRGRFGLDDLDVMAPFELGEFVVPARTPLRLVAKAAGVSVSVLRDYNPDLLRDQAPPGGDAIVMIPGDRVARALAAFPALYAREVATAQATQPEPPVAPRERKAAASAAPSAAPNVAVLPPAAVAGDRITLDNGVILELRPLATPSVSIAARVELVEPTRTSLRPTGKAWDVPPVTASEREMASGFARVAASVRRIVNGEGPVTELRRRVAEPARTKLEKAPYGPGWLALGDALWGSGPMSGSVVVAPLLPLASVIFVEQPRGGFRVTVHVDGSAPRAQVDAAARATLGRIFDDAGESTPHPRDERLVASAPITSPRLFMGWVGPPIGDANEPALRLALVWLANNQSGRLPHALVDRNLVSHLRGTLDLGERSSLAALEIEPAVPHEPDEILRELDKALDAAGAQAPAPLELTAAKEKLRTYLRAEAARGGRPGEARDAVRARADAMQAKVDSVTEVEVRDLVKRVFSSGHRVVVAVTPRR